MLRILMTYLFRTTFEDLADSFFESDYSFLSLDGSFFPAQLSVVRAATLLLAIGVLEHWMQLEGLLFICLDSVDCLPVHHLADRACTIVRRDGVHAS